MSETWRVRLVYPQPEETREREFNDYDAERMVEPEEPCEHPWLLTICQNPKCGVLIGMPRMHPEDI